MRTRIIQPPSSLRHLIRYFWVLELEELPHADFTIRTFSDDSSGIIFHCSEGTGLLQESGDRIPATMVYGIATAPTVTKVTAPFRAIGASFLPYAVKAILGVDARYLTDRIIPVNEFDKRFNFSEQIVNEPSREEQVVVIMNTIERNACKKYSPDAMVIGAIELIRRSQVRRVRDLTQYFKISERQLERRFLATLGVTPSHYIKTMKLQWAIELMREKKFDKLINIAYDLDFSDQAHFNKLIRDLSGLAPGKFQALLKDELVNLLIDSPR